MYTHNKQTKQENLRITLNLYLYVPLTHQLRCKYIAAALATLHGGLKAKDTLIKYMIHVLWNYTLYSTLSGLRLQGHQRSLICICLRNTL